MNLLIKSIKIADPNSEHNRKVTDVLIENGKIQNIKNKINSESARVYDGSNQYLSPGWFDMNVNFCDPGYEYKEDLISGCQAAAFGGFTGVACLPNTNPPLHNKAQIEYIIKNTKDNVVDVSPIGTISMNREGKELSEMVDMVNAGAIAFSDGDMPVTNAGLMLRAMLYSLSFKGLIISNANEMSISKNGMVNESVTSTMLGLKGIPSLAEELMIIRDIYLCEYSAARLHFAHVSTAKSIELIRKAKKQNLNLSSAVSINNLILDDSSLHEYDSNYKVMPPLRTKHNINALYKGLKDGTIDAITSCHTPHEEEMKKREFDHASFGIIGLETTFALINTHLRKILKIEDIINKLSVNPRKILNIPVPAIEVGNKANFTIFDTNTKWTFSEKHIHSKSHNTPFIGHNLIGKVKAIFNNNQFKTFN